ncbi:MAG: hypothetical protein HEQ32_04420 [Vampirovibrio sp.]
MIQNLQENGFNISDPATKEAVIDPVEFEAITRGWLRTILDMKQGQDELGDSNSY